MATRIKGKSGMIFKLATVDYGADLTTINLSNEDADADVTTFADAATGGATQWFFEGTAVSATDAGSLWNYLWSAAGATNVAYVYAPNGNTTPSVAKPHYTGTATIGRKPGIGGDAGSTFTFDFRIDVDQEPTKQTT